MHTTARLLLISTIAAAAFVSGGAVASADAAPEAVAAGTGSVSTGSASGVQLALQLMGAGSGALSPGGYQLVDNLRTLLVDSGSFTRCQLHPGGMDPTCMFG